MPIAREQWKEIDECVRTKQGISASRWDWTYRLGTKGRSRQDTLVGQYRVSKAHLEHLNWNLLVQRPFTRKTRGRKRLRLNPEKKDWRQRPETRYLRLTPRYFRLPPFSTPSSPWFDFEWAPDLALFFKWSMPCPQSAGSSPYDEMRLSRQYHTQAFSKAMHLAHTDNEEKDLTWISLTAMARHENKSIGKSSLPFLSLAIRVTAV